jgi:WD40 repeat protein
VRDVKMSADGMSCYSIGADGTLRLWDISKRKCVKVFKNEKHPFGDH